MAWMSQDHKKQIAVELKKVMPKDWKYSLSVHHHSTLVLTISAAPIDLIAENLHEPDGTYLQLNEFYLERAYSGELLKTFEAIKRVMNIGNWDRSDIQTDYFDVGHYVNICIGKWDKPFIFTGDKSESKKAA